jgi:hypothetical protein
MSRREQYEDTGGAEGSPGALFREAEFRTHRTLARSLHGVCLVHEVCPTSVRSSPDRLRIEDVDSERMVIHIRKGKGGKDRDVPPCPQLLETRREYWRREKPKTWHYRHSTARCARRSAWYEIWILVSRIGHSRYLAGVCLEARIPHKM